MNVNRRFGIPYGEPPQVIADIQPLENEAFIPLPTGTPGVLKFADVSPVGDPTDTLNFHCIGDSGGISDPNPQMAVVSALIAMQGAANFLYHVGDVVYFNGDAREYFPQFYEPYEHYNLPIFAIPGNHDGDNSDDPSVPSLTAFVENFCASEPHLTSESKDSNRDAMTQPYVYWALECNLAYFIGLYSNVPSGGEIESDQAEWLVEQLENAPTDRVLIVALHHPPYSGDAHHGGSQKMDTLLDQAFTEADRWPDMILTGHVHNYQRFERVVNSQSKIVPYFVNGAGGYHNLHEMAQIDGAPIVCPWKVPGDIPLTLKSYCDNQWGFLNITVQKELPRIQGKYIAVGRSGVAYVVDTFSYA